MEGICLGEGIVSRKKFIFRLFGCKMGGSCVYNESAEEQGIFSSHVACEVTHGWL